MFYLKKLLSALVLPPLGPIFLALIGIWLARRHPRLGRALAFVALVALLVLSLPPVADALTRSVKPYPPLPAQQLARAQAIVILGGGIYYDAPEYGGDTIGSASLERLRYGVHLQKRSGLPLLVTGGAPYGGRPEAEVMKEAAEHDFGARVRWVEAVSRDTAENAQLSALLLKASGVSRIALVSHASHLPRAVELFERQGFEVYPAPTGFSTPPPALFAQLLPSGGALGRSSNAIHEWTAILVQRLAK